MADVLILVAFVAWSVASGLRARKTASRDLDQYLLAGRRLNGWQAGTSMAATQFAADTPLLVAGLVATAGLSGLWRLWIYGLAFLLMGYLFAALWRRSGVLTDAELVERRYSGRGLLALRSFKALYYGTVFNCVVLAMVLVAAVGIAEIFLPWHLWLPPVVYGPWLEAVRASGLTIVSTASSLPPAVASANNVLSIAAILGFTALYSMTGGLRAVVATDLVQFVLAMAGSVLFAIWVVDAAGGLDGLVARLARLYGEERAAATLALAPGLESAWLAFATVLALQWVFQINSDGTGYLAQRAMACRDDHEARFAAVLFAWLQIALRSLPWLVIGVGLMIVYPFTPEQAAQPGFAAERELLFARGMDDLLPPGVRGLALTALLAALASTLDTHMNWGASYWCNDLYRRLLCQAWLRREPGGRELVAVARLSNVLILLLALAVMTRLDSIQQAWQVTLLFGAGVGSVLILRWVWERVNLWAELAAMAVSIVVAPAWLWWSPRIAWLQEEPMRAQAAGLALVGLTSTAAVLVAAHMGPRSSPAVLATFYRQVRPPGFWRQTAAAQGDDPAQVRARLTRALTGAMLAGASLYLALYGSTRLLLPLPAGSPLLPAGALLIAVLLVPPWWRRLRPDAPASRRLAGRSPGSDPPA